MISKKRKKLKSSYCHVGSNCRSFRERQRVMYDLTLRHSKTVKKTGFFFKGCSCRVEGRQQFVEQGKYCV